MTKLQEAINYLNYCAKNGCEVDYEGRSDQEIIDLANSLEGQADAAYDAYKERFND